MIADAAPSQEQAIHKLAQEDEESRPIFTAIMRRGESAA
jgi:hypothetical protein